jgi:hypothetical protein
MWGRLGSISYPSFIFIPVSGTEYCEINLSGAGDIQLIAGALHAVKTSGEKKTVFLKTGQCIAFIPAIDDKKRKVIRVNRENKGTYRGLLLLDDVEQTVDILQAAAESIKASTSPAWPKT